VQQIPSSLGPFKTVKKKRFTSETYVRIHTEQHSVLNGLKDYGYAGIYDSSKVHHLIKGIKRTELDVCKTQVMASPSLRDDFSATFIKQMKAENTQLNVSEVSFARGKAGKNSFGKRNSSGISNVSNDAVDDRFFETLSHTLSKEYVKAQAPRSWKYWKRPYQKWQWQWQEQREGTYHQISHPFHCGTDYQD
jgi:hypothetical protein